ncbi:hypothetical protein QTO34_007904 [Cnephaeus nilssonii]|uniref:Uncharacterized protein n=1 Tax=Cnephaeus nilssonii TaxID=3371016 RepID=A0AA40IAC6_CNENI|nr:hypothetical protein QTO34_007904 [Eptesicus nilssonii]
MYWVLAGDLVYVFSKSQGLQDHLLREAIPGPDLAYTSAHRRLPQLQPCSPPCGPKAAAAAALDPEGTQLMDKENRPPASVAPASWPVRPPGGPSRSRICPGHAGGTPAEREPLRSVIFPMEHHDIGQMYTKAEASCGQLRRLSLQQAMA